MFKLKVLLLYTQVYILICNVLSVYKISQCFHTFGCPIITHDNIPCCCLVLLKLWGRRGNMFQVKLFSLSPPHLYFWNYAKQLYVNWYVEMTLKVKMVFGLQCKFHNATFTSEWCGIPCWRYTSIGALLLQVIVCCSVYLKVHSILQISVESKSNYL